MNKDNSTNMNIDNSTKPRKQEKSTPPHLMSKLVRTMGTRINFFIYRQYIIVYTSTNLHHITLYKFKFKFTLLACKKLILYMLKSHHLPLALSLL